MIIVQILIGLSLASVVLSAGCYNLFMPALPWNDWSACSKTCGGGTRTRTCIWNSNIQTESCGRICLNGGQYNGNCDCPPGTHGQCCDDILECASNPCQNGGTCNEMINMYNCSCPPDFIGKHCEKDLFTLHEHSCRYGSHSGCYVVFRRKDSWQEAEEFCEARQGHLAVPNDTDEALYIESFLERLRGHFSDARFWIGGHNAGSGTVQWAKDETSNVYRWPVGVQHDPQGAECVLMDGGYNFKWQSISCDAHMYFVCEESIIFNIIG